MSIVKVVDDDVVIGNTIPWSLYDGKGTLLLQKGSMITSIHQLSLLLDRGMYRNETNSDEAETAEVRKPITKDSNPFDIFNDLAYRITEIFSRVVQKREITYGDLQDFSRDFLNLCEKDAEAALGAVHLCHSYPYTICHPLHSAILSELIAKRLGYEIEMRITLIAAALTANLGMLDLQEILHHQRSPVTEEQKVRVQNHPEESIKMLMDAGIVDTNLLQIIKQHHERINSNGYPDQLDKAAIVEGAQIIAIADRYAAMVSSRSYRKSLTSKDALREFFLQKNKEFDERLTLTFIKELGIFPPGTYVMLNNGETAVVIERGKESMWPVVASVLGPRGAPFDEPPRRDSNCDAHSIRDIKVLNEPLKLNLETLWGYRN